MMTLLKKLPHGKKLYFASDFHLGAPTAAHSREREHKVVRWLDSIKKDAAAIFLVGDIFDFWFEYRHAIPKGFVRFQGKVAELADSGIPIHFFTGNHDMWMFGYLEDELKVKIHRQPISFDVDGSSFMVGHGDGLGPGDHTYKFLKKIFSSKVCQWLFARVHPNLGIGIAQQWSRRSRISNDQDEVFLGEDEWLMVYCREMEKIKHHDHYIFGHRHLPLDLEVGKNARYINLGEWAHHCTYARFDGEELELKTFEA